MYGKHDPNIVSPGMVLCLWYVHTYDLPKLRPVNNMSDVFSNLRLDVSGENMTSESPFSDTGSRIPDEPSSVFV